MNDIKRHDENWNKGANRQSADFFKSLFCVFRKTESNAPEAPIRAELFSLERLEQHAASLAAQQHVAAKPERNIEPGKQLNDNSRVLSETYRVVVNETSARQPITPAAEWFLDNFHIVDEQVREIKRGLPAGFYQKLPKVAEGPLRGYPRVYGIAWALTAHTDSSFDLQKLTCFAAAYQRVQPLTIGELWAFSIVLRIILVENLRRLAEEIQSQLAASRKADALADRILGTENAGPEPELTIKVSLDQMPWSAAFASELARRLRDNDPDLTPALRWLNNKMAAESTTTEQVLREGFQRQSATDASVRNVITSMRLVSMLNWPEFVESVSPIDAVLRSESDFAAMDFSTRDRYRHAIEEIAHESGRDEVDVAKQAITAARRTVNPEFAAQWKSDPGYHLIGGGRRAFEKELGSRVPFRARLFNNSTDLGVMSYVGVITFASVVLLAFALFIVGYSGIGGWQLLVLACVGLIPATDVAVAIVNRVITHQVSGKVLPGLELHRGITPDLRTIVVIPTVLSDVSTIRKLIERLEDHYLSNRDSALSFALISDWQDSRSEHVASDQSLLDEANSGIARLNNNYGVAGGGARFFLLYRRRVWNASEAAWIGWERKRGKLHELNRLLRGASDTTFLPVNGHSHGLPSDVRYVVTLDADTRLPIGTVRRLVGKMAHPLNTPFYDNHAGVVARGHAVLQPRVIPSLPMGREGSLFERTFSGQNGLDPYALADSDVYQNLYEEGSFCGKGIYEIDSFDAALKGQIPENSVLSHDLLEGIFARAGLASDIEVVEEFPSRYAVASARQHRWVRGDWQLLPWIFGYRRKTSDGSRTLPIPLMGRWKLFDNLRRSLSAPAALLSLLIGWLLPMTSASVWTGFILLAIALPPLLPVITGVFPLRVGASLRFHMRTLRGDFALGFVQSAFLIIFLAHQAWLMVDAVMRTLFRLFIRRRYMLEWMTTAQTENESQFDRRGLILQVMASVGSGCVVALLLYYQGQRSWAIAVPFVMLWMLSPFIAHWASLEPAAADHLSVSAKDALALRLVARRTWRFFEKFVTAKDNMLPPDNFQEDPNPVIAHRTSPTNIGLYLLSIIAARDFGWLGTLDALERLEATFTTMSKLQRFKGHFYNWYETTDLRALEPKYISSVDSGNLAGHLIVLGNACREIISGPVFAQQWTSGLMDTLALLQDSVHPQTTQRRPLGPKQIQLDKAIEAFSETLINVPSNPMDIAQWFSNLVQLADVVLTCAHALGLKSGGSSESQIIVWAEALHTSILSHRSDFDLLMPWANLPAPQIPLGKDSAVLLGAVPSLIGMPGHCKSILRLIAMSGQGKRQDGLTPMTEALAKSASAAQSMMERLSAIADRCKAMVDTMEFGFLYDSDRQLLSIGYRAADNTLDGNFYDLLASEARLASFVAIAKGDLPAKHWFRLGRTLTAIDGSAGLMSWSGSMFEFLMPSLVMRTPTGSLLAQTNRLVVWRQEKYGDGLAVPWGISESAYNFRDIEKTYQYSSFGVPDLGFKRGLGKNIVVAPYASGLAAMIDPAAAAHNYSRLANVGACGVYGWYEALDYTPTRLPEGTTVAIIGSYMAHHQGMTIIAIANALQDGRMHERFHTEPIIRAAELLLQERMPRDVALAKPPSVAANATSEDVLQDSDPQRHYTSAHAGVPRTHLLSNGRYTTMVTAAGSGYSRWHDIAITRWREDTTCDSWGAYIFLRDIDSGAIWSAGYQPSAAQPDSYDVAFSEDCVKIVRSDSTLSVTLEIIVSPEDDAEVRRVSITNHDSQTRNIELTSYAEVALARQPDDVAHPAFAALFVETEFVSQLGALVATRRQRSASDPLVWAAHLAVVEGESAGDMQFETDRARFLGRGQTIRSPAAIAEDWPLSNTTGAVLDPIFSIRRQLQIAPGNTARVAFWTMAAASRESVLALADRHQDMAAFDRAKTVAWTQAQMQLHHLGITRDEAHLFQRLANPVLYSNLTMRPPAGVIKSGARKASTLWSQGISGDLPIVLVRIDSEDHLELVRQILQAHECWRTKQLSVDLVILNTHVSSYAQNLQTSLEALVRMNQSKTGLPSVTSGGKVVVLRADLVSAEISSLLYACARAVLYGDRGSMSDQINRARDLIPPAPPPAWPIVPAVVTEVSLPRPDMEFFNGLGGFSNNGRDYLTILENKDRTPLPWVNVVANPLFGFQVSTEGSGFTWSVNSQQNQLTPWSNDPVGDQPGEAIYLRDEDTGEVWTPTSLPIRDKKSAYAAKHGQGYSEFEHDSHGISLKLLQFVPIDDSIKISRLTITNHSGRARRVSITAYVEWVLGQNRSASAPFVVAEIDSETGAILATNPWNEQFGERVAFLDLNGKQTACTCDRREFLGRNGALDRPAALTPGTVLSNRVGAGLDPCGVLQTKVNLKAAETTDIVVFLGQAATKTEVHNLLKKYRAADLGAVFAAVTKQWDDTLGVVQVKTPDRSLDIMLNRWLPYQTLACRVWARTAFYQASGAYGFRDQLQDVMALCVSRPDLAREHVLRAAARQFLEGDVQHWWLPESGRGVRTRVSDDRIWLALVVAHYVRVTGDHGVLDEKVSFLEGPILKEGERDAYFLPTISTRAASLFEHCALALDKSLATGAHGLPLMGTGDWNDGMDAVGKDGKGESVWLGWFLYAALDAFAAIADNHGDGQRAADWRRSGTSLKESLEREAWDGDWYRRAFFDDGSPLGSATNNQCRIDSIAQSWSVISGAADPARATRAMAALDKYLVRRDDKLLPLFTPPFNNPAQDPGYIKGYPAGVRENGGQYTHGALWAVLAFVMQGDGDKAGEMLSMLNPIRHADSADAVHRYKVEPYVISADIYSEPPHVGRGGWTWYTGSAGWMYQVALEGLLGFQLEGDKLVIDPCIPRGWPGFEIVFRHRSTRYEISVKNPQGVCRGIMSVELDGEVLATREKQFIPLVNDGNTHHVQIILGSK